MSDRNASCPGCGATLEFHNAATLFIVCPSCGGASSREDATLELLGKVAAVADIESVLSVGACGVLGGGEGHQGRRWRAVGQVQLDHGLGPWNEWCLSFEDGTWAWLAEAQGELLLTRETEGVDSAKFASRDALTAGEDLLLGTYGRFVVGEIGEGTVTAVKGELPFAMRPGNKVCYADLRGPDGGFATLDYGSEKTLESVYVGYVVTVEALGIDASTVDARAPKEIAAKRLQCPKCGASIDVRDPRNSVRVVCSSCGSMLDPRKSNLKVIEMAAQLAAQPEIALGTKGTIHGLKVEVIAFLIRSVHVEGRRYPWSEYLLKTERGGFRWLVQSNGHWNYVEPLGLGDVRRTGLTGGASHKGIEYRHFQGGKARVDHVQGEVYWEVAVGEEVRTDDFVAPPRMLSFEGMGKEQVVSLCTYTRPEEIAAAFGLPSLRSTPVGIAPNQPNPSLPSVRRTWMAYVGFAALVLALMAYFHSTAAKEVLLDKNLVAKAQTAAPVAPPAGPAEAPSDVFLSDDFATAPASGNVEVELWTQMTNAWMGIDGALVNVETGEVHSFELDAERWSGTEGGEAWAEGNGHGSVYLSEVPAGRYALRLDPVTSGASTDLAYRVLLRSQVPSGWRVLWLLLLLVVWPVCVSIAAASFEKKRWSESDHDAPSTFSGGGGDDE